MTTAITLLTIGLALLAAAYALLALSLRIQVNPNESLSNTLFDLYARHEWLELRVLELEEKADSDIEVQVTPKLYVDQGEAAKAVASSIARQEAIQRIVIKGAVK